MAKNECTGARCIRKTQAELCTECAAELVRRLQDLAFRINDAGERTPGLCRALEEAEAKLTRGRSTGTGRAGGYAPRLPFDPPAAAVRQQLTMTIGRWVRAFLEAYPSTPGPTHSSVAAAAEWLAGHRRKLATLWCAGDMHREIVRIVARVERIVDRTSDLRYVGICSARLVDGAECEEDLYARPDRPTITCRACGTRHDVEHRRGQLAKAVEDQLATAVDCSRIVPNLIGRELSASTIRHWARIGKLTPKPPHPDDERELPRYRLGDVVKLARETPTRRRKGVKPQNQPRAA